MTAPSFTYSGNVYTAAAAGATDFALTSSLGNAIAYLQPAHIHVYKSTDSGASWTELTRPSQWNFASSGTVARLSAGIASGDWIKVQRITPSSSAYVTFQSSSLLTADQLNDDTLFNTYLNQERYDQGDQSSVVAAAASAAATTATAAATAATASANSASAAAAAATATANAASASAATALSQSGTAVTDSAAALAASAAAVTTANTAASNAASAVTTAGTANTNATAAVSTANSAAADTATALAQSNTAIANSATALSTATAAATNAATALSQSNTAITGSTTALSNANTAVTTANSATSTANTALSTANAAASAVANAVLYDTVANVAAIPSTPANNDAVEVVNSTGIETFTPLNGLPPGFVGDAGLSVRMIYTTTGTTWNWVQYFPNDPEARYGVAITTLQTDLTTAEGDITTLQGDVAQAQIDILALDSAKLDATTAASTYQTQAGMSSYLTTATAGTTYAPLASPTFTGTVTIPAGASISGYLTSATAASTYQTQAGMSSYLTAYTTTTTATSKTLANRERCTVTASGQTITLPASPSAGWEVSITVAGTFTNTTIARNGTNIMSLAENMTIDKGDITVTLYYVDATRGWRII